MQTLAQYSTEINTVRIAGERQPRHYDVDAHGGSFEDSVEIGGPHCDVEITAYGVAGMIRRLAGPVAPDRDDERIAAAPRAIFIESRG